MLFVITDVKILVECILGKRIVILFPVFVVHRVEHRADSRNLLVLGKDFRKGILVIYDIYVIADTRNIIVLRIDPERELRGYSKDGYN